MQENLDLQLLARVSELEQLQKFLYAAIDQQLKTPTRLHGGLRPLNLVEVALVVCRRGSRPATWLAVRAVSQRVDAIDIPALLRLRARFAKRLDAIPEISKSRVDQIATYLASTACPSSSDLAIFAKVHSNTARAWLQALGESKLLLTHHASNVINCINTEVLSLLSGLDAIHIRTQFEATVSRKDWLKRSIYSTNLNLNS